MNTLQMGARYHRMGEHDPGWLSMNSAPRDGTVVELMCTYGVAPWYSLCRWTREDMAHGRDGLMPFTKDEPSWVKVEGGGGPFSEGHLKWRPYDGDAAAYVDPTGGAQNDMAYWRGAAAARHGLPLDYFEAEAARNERRNKLADGQPRRSLGARIMRTLFGTPDEHGGA